MLQAQVQSLELHGTNAEPMCATLRLALWCRRKLPAVDGKVGWAERFTGPVVTSMFEALLSVRAAGGWGLRWKGCVVVVGICCRGG